MITDPRHADAVRIRGHRLWDELLDFWQTEHYDASAPRSGPAVQVTGGETSNPTADIAEDDQRESHARWIGSRITGLLDALNHEVKKLVPTVATELAQCSNCAAAPATDSTGRCDICGPYWRNAGREYSAATAKRRHLHRDEFRPCQQCGEDIRIGDGDRTCRRCKAA